MMQPERRNDGFVVLYEEIDVMAVAIGREGYLLPQTWLLLSKFNTQGHERRQTEEQKMRRLSVCPFIQRRRWRSLKRSVERSDGQTDKK